MPLPHYRHVKVYKETMEVILFDNNLEEVSLEISSPIEKINSNGNIIKFITQSYLDIFKEYKILNYIQYDIKGNVIRSSFFTISKMSNFVNYEYSFIYTDSKDFYTDEEVSIDEYKSYIRSIKRDIKLSKLLQ